MSKLDLVQIRVTPEQKKMLVSAAGSRTLSDYILGQLFVVTTSINDSPKRIATKKITVGPLPELSDAPVLDGVRVGKPWVSMGKQRSMFRRDDGTEYEGWLP